MCYIHTPSSLVLNVITTIGLVLYRGLIRIKAFIALYNKIAFTIILLSFGILKFLLALYKWPIGLEIIALMLGKICSDLWTAYLSDTSVSCVGTDFYSVFLGQRPWTKARGRHENNVWTYTLSYLSFGAFSEEEHWFRAKWFHHNKRLKIHLPLRHVRNWTQFIDSAFLHVAITKQNGATPTGSNSS